MSKYIILILFFQNLYIHSQNTYDCFDNNCLTCSSKEKGFCTSCKHLNVILSEGSCYFCNDVNCESCSDLTPNGCTKCNSNFKLKDGSCALNCLDPNCDICTNENTLHKCTKCQTGYSVYSYECMKNLPCSIPNCHYCLFSEECFQCMENFKIKNGLCEPKCYDEELCFKCSDSTQFGCEECTIGILLLGECHETYIIILLGILFIVIIAVSICFVVSKVKRMFEARLRAAALSNNHIIINDPNYFKNIQEKLNINAGINKDNINDINNQTLPIETISELSHIKMENKNRSFDLGNVEKNKLFSQQEINLSEKELKVFPCVICGNNNGIYKTNCGCHICGFDRKKLRLDEVKEHNENIERKELKESVESQLCPKCKVEINSAEKINVKLCDICYEIKNILVSFHDNCNLKVCLACQYKCITISNKCPFCRKEVYELKSHQDL